LKAYLQVDNHGDLITFGYVEPAVQIKINPQSNFL